MNAEEYSQLLSETDTMIDRLHALYEQWFQGLERREPLKQRDIVHKRLESLRANMPQMCPDGGTSTGSPPRAGGTVIHG